LQRPRRIAVLNELTANSGLPFTGGIIVAGPGSSWKPKRFGSAAVLHFSPDSAHRVRAEGVGLVCGGDLDCVATSLELVPDPLIVVVTQDDPDSHPRLKAVIAKKRAGGREVICVKLLTGLVVDIDTRLDATSRLSVVSPGMFSGLAVLKVPEAPKSDTPTEGPKV